MNRQMLQEILNRTETEEMLFGWEDVSEWSKGALDSLRALKLLRAASPASVMDCSDCERGCLAAPVVVVSRPDRTQQAYLECPEYVRAEKPIECLNRWQVDIDGLAARLAGELGGTAEELVPGRLWLIGRPEISGARTDVLLARGLGWPDGDRVLREVRSRTAVVIVPARAGIDAASGDSLEIVSLDEVLLLDGDVLSVDVPAIRDAVSRVQAASAVGLGGRPERCRYLFKEGVDTWAIVYDDVAVNPPLKNSKGLRYIAFLLARPNQEHYALQIMHEVDGTPYEPDEVHAAMSEDELNEQGLSVSGFTDAGQVMDKEYEKDCRDRLSQAQGDLKRAEARNDTTLSGQARNEIEQYRRALNEGIGKGGRHRATGNAAEKARVAVTQAIKRVLNKLQTCHVPLYEHLSSSVHTGTVCSYTPTAPIDWNF